MHRIRKRKFNSPRQAFGARSSRILAVLVLALGVAMPAAMAGAPGMAAAAPACPAGHACAYNVVQGQQVDQLCVGGHHYIGITGTEAVNACANKAIYLYWVEGESLHYKGCINPGGWAVEPTRFNIIEVDIEGSRC